MSNSTKTNLVQGGSIQVLVFENTTSMKNKRLNISSLRIQIRSLKDGQKVTIITIT